MSKRMWSAPQREAIESRGSNVLVSAGAGSGKTTVLVERVMRLLLDEPRLDVHRLLIVTFTEAAASEMRHRIGEEIRRRLDLAESAQDEETVAHLSRQLSLLDVAQISTLHSFCMSVVRRNFMTLGLEPGFRMIGEHEATLLRQALVEQLLEQRLRDNDGAVGVMLDAFGAADPLSVIPLVFRMDEFSRSQPLPTEWLRQLVRRFQEADGAPFSDTAWTGWFYRWMARIVAESIALFVDAAQVATGIDELAQYRDNLEKLRNHSEQTLRLVQGQASLDDIVSVLSALSSEKTPRAAAHALREEVKERRTAALARLKSIRMVIERGETALAEDVSALTPAVTELVDFVLEFQRLYAASKLQKGVLDFNDLEHFALRALGDKETGEAERLRDHFCEIFVDEYQDTSPIQDAIVTAIARVEGNVFVVGDVKQSIYRFRMAEPRIFLSKYSTMSARGEGRVISLSSNYRSRTSVVDAVNTVFCQLFTPMFGGVAYDEAARMVAGAVYPDTSNPAVLAGPVEVHLIERMDATSAADELEQGSAADPSDSAVSSDVGDVDDAVSAAELQAIQKESLVIADRIRSWMGQTGEGTARQIWDKDEGVYRHLRYRDIVILLRSVKGRMNSVLEVLRSTGIPAYGATSTGFFDALEIQWMMAALSTLDLPRSELNLVTLLRSPLFRFTDEELALIRLRNAGNFFDAVRSAARRPRETTEVSSESGMNEIPISPALRRRCKSFLSTLSEWRALARKASAAEVTRTVVRDTGISDYVLGMEGGEIRRANLQLLLDRAAQYDSLSNDGVFGFASWLKQVVAHDLDAGEARTLAESEDVVRVMTIHQSKGLEFPVVFVADLGKLFYESPTERALPLHPELGFGPERVDIRRDQRWKTMASIAVQEANQTEFRAEEARVLYVALTRARDQLVLVGSARGVDRLIQKSRSAASALTLTLPLATLLNARTYLDWLVPVWLRHRDGGVLRDRIDVELPSPSRLPDDTSRLAIHLWNLPGGAVLPSMDNWASESHSPAVVVPDARDLLREWDETHGSRFEAAATAAIRDVRRMEPVPSKVSATDLRRLWVAKQHGERRVAPHPGTAKRLLRGPSWEAEPEPTTAGKDLGTAFHAVMQRIDLTKVAAGEPIAGLLEEMVDAGTLDSDTLQRVSVEDIAGFFKSSLGQQIVRAKRLFREQPFFCRIPVQNNADAKLAAGRGGSFVVAQGVIDVLAECDAGWLIVDYKTDSVNAEDVEDKAEEYRAQVATYIRAVQTLVGQAPVEGVLYFVRPGIALKMETLNLEDLWRSPSGR